MKKLRLHLDGAFSKEIREELYRLTMAGRWWLAYALSGDNPKVLEALFEDSETSCRDQGILDLAVFEDGSAINWHEGELFVYWDISNLLERYDQFRLDQLEPYEAALLDYPVLEKYRSLLCSETAEDP
jgi:hypothetical protein